MEALQIIAAIAISAALMILIWSIKALLMHLASRARPTRDGFVLTEIENASELENTVRCILWQRRRLGLDIDIYIVDEGMDDEERHMAEIFSRENDCVKIVFGEMNNISE